MKLTATQQTTYRHITDIYLKAINSRADHPDDILTNADLFPGECEVLHIIPWRHGLEELEVWLLTLGFGDEGGRSLVTAHVDVREPGDEEVIFIATHFDTASYEIFRLSYIDNNAIWFGKEE